MRASQAALSCLSSDFADTARKNQKLLWHFQHLPDFCDTVAKIALQHTLYFAGTSAKSPPFSSTDRSSTPEPAKSSCAMFLNRIECILRHTPRSMTAICRQPENLSI